MKKRLVGVFALSAAFGLCGLGSTALAQTPFANENSTVNCQTVTKGALKFAPALITGGSSLETIKVSGTLGGCGIPGHPEVVFPEGKSKFKGVLTSPTNDCMALNGASATAGSLTFTWGVAAPGVTQKTSTVNITGAFGSSAIINGGLYGQFNLGPPNAPPVTVTGGFTGGDAGATSTAAVVTQQSAITLGTFCTPPALGIKAINIGVANITLQ